MFLIFVEDTLVADDGDFGGGDFEALEAVVFVEIEHDFEIGGGYAEAVVGFAVGGGDGAGGFDGDRAGSEFLRNEDGHRLRAAFGPIVDAGDDGVLIVEIVVEHGDERGAEAHVLFEGARALHLQGDFGDAVGEEDAGAVGFVGLRLPLVADGGAVGLQA